jgi:hypothetical protein
MDSRHPGRPGIPAISTGRSHTAERPDQGRLCLFARAEERRCDLAAAPSRGEGCARSPTHAQGAPLNCQYFFWTGLGAWDGHFKTVDRTLKAVFAASKVAKAHAHRFRPTLATEILIAGGTIEDCANILGDSPEIIRRHYAKWSPAYHRRTVEIMNRVHCTYTAHGSFQFVSDSSKRDYLVLEEGVEPSCPAKGAGF